MEAVKRIRAYLDFEQSTQCKLSSISYYSETATQGKLAEGEGAFELGH
jgi:hypothetical protein